MDEMVGITVQFDHEEFATLNILGVCTSHHTKAVTFKRGDLLQSVTGQIQLPMRPVAGALWKTHDSVQVGAVIQHIELIRNNVDAPMASPNCEVLTIEGIGGEIWLT